MTEKERTEKTSVALVEDKVKGMRKMVEDTTVTNQAELEDVANKISMVKKMGKFVRQEMERYTKPAREIIKNAQDKFLPYEKECKQAEDDLKKKAQVYMIAEEEKRKKQEEKIAKDLDTGKIKKEETALRKMEEIGEQKKTVDTGGAKLTMKKVRVAHIVDPEQVPKEYWIIDEARVKKAAVAGAVIPGVEVREESQMASR